VRSRSPLLLLLALLGLLAGACAGDGQIGGPTIGGTPAAQIGDRTVSNGDLRDEVEKWASNPTMLQAINVQGTGTAGRRSASLVTFALSHRVVSEQARIMLAEARERAAEGDVDLDEAGVDGEALSEPGDQEIDGILAQLDQQFTGPEGISVFRGFDDDFRRRLATDLAYQERLQLAVQLGVEAPEVSVNPRYGRPEVLQGGIVQVVPPTGPQPAPFTGA
jgi:hypothetical protein